jgi:hypothetical protein
MIRSLVTRFAAGLRYPTLFKLVGVLFLVDFFVPDLVPFIDEILLGLGTLLLGSLRTRGRVAGVAEGTMETANPR